MRPSVPEEHLTAGAWTLTEESTETLFRLGALRVEGHTRLYEDAVLRDAIAAVTTNLEGPWRFFFATGLDFEPSLGETIGVTLLAPTVAAEARRTFTADLRDRGFRTIERDRTRRIRVASGEGARSTSYLATHVVESDDAHYTLTIEAWLAVWVHEGAFRIAGGAYPARGLDALLADIGADASVAPPHRYREDLLDLITAVG